MNTGVQNRSKLTMHNCVLFLFWCQHRNYMLIMMTFSDRWISTPGIWRLVRVGVRYMLVEIKDLVAIPRSWIPSCQLGAQPWPLA